MKKTLVAVAAVVAATGAIAGNSVTLYGVADVWVGGLKAKGSDITQFKIDSGGAASSRIGIRVKEDLGGGMYAAVKMEQGVGMDDGSRSSREHWLALGGDFGEIRLGRNDNSADDIMGGFIDASQDTKLSAINGAFGVWGFSTDRMNNSIRYVSPDFDGFYGSATYSTGENKAKGKKADNAFGGMIAYEGGPFGIAASYDVNNVDGAPDPSSYHLGAYYDFGQFKLNGGFGVFDPEYGKKTNMVGIGAGFTVDNIYVAASLAAAETDNDRTTAFGLEGRYNLSKRTLAYAGFTTGKDKGQKAGRLFAVGMLHKF